MTTDTQSADAPPSAALTALKLWASAYRVEIWLFAISFCVLAMFSGQRFLRQSAAPHFVYQAKAWLEGRADIDAHVLPNFEDWACVREVSGVKQRCEGQPQATDHWYSSFPWFPSVVMAPFVAIHGYQLNDTSFGVVAAALALALFYSLLRLMRTDDDSKFDNITLAALLGAGTLFFYCAIRGEVWFSAEVMGVAFTSLYLRQAIGARNPMLAGLFWSMAVLTRTPLFFTGIFFVLEAVSPEKGKRLEQWKVFAKTPKPALELLGRFALGAAPLGLLAAVYNVMRFGSVAEFGHRFFFNNRVNVDIDTWGLFHPHYLLRNLDAAFGLVPEFKGGQLLYSPWGLSLFITLPLLALAFVPSSQVKRAFTALGAMAVVLVLSAVLGEDPTPGEPPVGHHPMLFWVALALTLGLFGWWAWKWVSSPDSPRLAAPLLIALAACALPGLFYQNTGYAQFGFRFSLDYTPYVLALVALAGWSFRKPLPMALAALSVAANFWGAVAFRGYTELVRRW